jgi:GDP/UDP-N,N'-diacetylbacillosamine 2-epimerase (hydrolysing)
MKICIVTGSRAEFGILENLIKKLNKDKFFNIDLIVTGSHLSRKYGSTINEIIKSKIKINKKIKILDEKKNNFPNYISKTFIKFSKFIKTKKYEYLLILGDRSEAYCFSLAAYFNRLPIIHFHGGEVTLGSLDNFFRNSISMMSNYHFVATQKSKKKLINMKNSKSNIFNVGSLSLENLKNFKFLKKKHLENEIKVKFKKKLILVNFFSESLKKDYGILNLKNLLKNLNKIKNATIIFTLSSHDNGLDKINNIILNFVKTKNNVYVFKSLGNSKYFSLLKYANLLIGNSSSGLIEFPFFKKPTINIGYRQSGREKASSVHSIISKKTNIYKEIIKLLNKKYSKLYNPYYKKNTSTNVIKILKSIYVKEKNKFN